MPLLEKDDIKKEAYDNFIRTSPYARISQDRNWHMVKGAWDEHYIYLEEGKIIAALSILSIKAVGDKRLFYANRGPVCDFTDVNLVKRLVDEASKHIKDLDPFLLRIDPEFVYDDEVVKAYREAGFNLRSRETDIHSFTQPRFNMILKLKGKTEEEVFNEFSSKTRYNIRLAERKGVETDFVESSSPKFLEAIDTFYDLTEIMAKRNGITYRPKDYFIRMFEAFPKSRVYLTKHEEDYLSAALAIPYNKKLFYMYGASSNEKRNLMPNYQMQWEMIKWAMEMGMEEYDFGGVFSFDNSDGLYRFKNGFVRTEGPTEFIGELDIVFDEGAYKEFIERK
ncbi:MAG: aminoacyltransferase [Tissierellia bacterium]|nr:aminoacyltransferase [Tissierellia bacterium]